MGDVVEYVYASMDPEQASLSRIRALQQGETPVRLVQYKNRDGEQKQENLAEHRWTENLVMLDAASVIELSSSREGLMFALWRAVDDGATPAARCAALLNLASLHESYIEQSALVESSFRRWDDLDRVCGNGREAKLQKDEIQGRREKYAKP